MTQLVISGRIAQQTGEIPVALIMRRERHHIPTAGIQLDHGAVRKVDRPGITGVLRSAQDDRMAVQKQMSAPRISLPNGALTATHTPVNGTGR